MPKRVNNSKALNNAFSKASDSYAPLLYGVLTVILLFAIIFMLLQFISQKSGVITNEAGKTSMEQPNTYIVREGDSLWSIAENVYSDGYKWTELAMANHLENPDQIEVNMRLVLPTVTKTTAPPAVQSSPSTDEKITGDKYAVREGDCLWTIALRAYGDGYKWSELASKNNILNPDLIYPGDIIQIPR